MSSKIVKVNPGITFKKLGLTDWTRFGLKMYHFSEDPEAANKFRMVGEITKDEYGFTTIPIKIHESVIQELIGPFLQGGSLVIPEEGSKPCLKVPGKRKAVAKLPSQSRPQKKKS